MNIIMHLRYLFIFLLFVFVTACASTNSSDTANKADKATAHYKIGRSYYNESKFQQAYIEFQKALEINPKDTEVLNGIGIIQLVQFEDSEKAIEYFKRALKVDKDFSEAWNNLGVAYERTGKIDEAIAAYEKAVANPMYKNPEKAYNSLGRIYYRAGQYDKAIDSLISALRRVNDYYPSFYNLALCYNAKGHYGDAATALMRAIELDPLYRGDRKKALQDFDNRRITARGPEVNDYMDFIEILRY
jgi:type IV pilus biogenesis/stability protein PilW